jgi:chromosome condensin MukBEF ATPase and DNA-binding subunit MukB
MLETKTGIEIKKCDDEIRELEKSITESENESNNLESSHGIDAEVCALAEKLGAIPIPQRYTAIDDLKEAASIEAKLGPMTRGLIVKDMERAVKEVQKLDPKGRELWLTTAENPAKALPSSVLGSFQRVDHVFQKTPELAKRPDRKGSST